MEDDSPLFIIVMLASAVVIYWRASTDIRNGETTWHGITVSRRSQPTLYWLIVGMYCFSLFCVFVVIVSVVVRAAMGLSIYM